ncbi:MAG TPA: hypothetical protein VKU84_01810, partial [Stellaceae bacterium]|nr:hypothetical protein [Stellaceae bacterium]
MPDGGSYGGSGGYFDQNVGPFLDPRQMAWMGMAQSVGQMAMPSRLPVPPGAVLGAMGGGAMQGAGDAFRNRLYSSEAANTGADAQLKQNQLAYMKLQQQLLGRLPPPNKNAAIATAAGGGAATMTPTPDMAAAGVDTTKPMWWMQPGAIDPMKLAAKREAAGAAALPPIDLSQGNDGTYRMPASPPAGTSGASAPPLFDVPSIYHQALLASAYGSPMASAYLDLAKTVGSTMTNAGVYLGADNRVYTAPGANEAQMGKALSEKGYEQQPDGAWAINPALVKGAGATAAAEAWGKAPAELYVARNTPKTLRGPGSVYYDPMTQTSVQIPNEIDTVDNDPASPTYGAGFKKFVPLGLVREGGGGGPQPQPSNGPPAPAKAAPGNFQPGSAALPTGRNVNDVFRSQLRLPPASPTTAPSSPSSAAPVTTLQPGPAPQQPSGEPTFQTKLGPMQQQSLEARGRHLEEYGANLDADAESSKTNNFLLDQMRRESQSWDMGKFANVEGDVRAYASAFAHSFGVSPDWIDKPLGDLQAFNKNSMELTRQVVRATSSRAAV